MIDFSWFEALIKNQKEPPIEREVYCEQCGERFIEQPDTRDPGICSLDCGYRYRGLRPSDFL